MVNRAEYSAVWKLNEATFWMMYIIAQMCWFGGKCQEFDGVKVGGIGVMFSVGIATGRRRAARISKRKNIGLILSIYPIPFPNTARF